MASQDSGLLLTFARAIGLFMVATLAYFIFGSILYSWIGGGMPAVKAFWRNAVEPSATALGTCSSLGTLPVTCAPVKRWALTRKSSMSLFRCWLT
ncbi:Sodium:dicarboxylate symporter family [Raoultella ornithinolytica]|nr:Sodium:dicarboxylate symporter family [Raoultella ornithinolytica]